LDIHELIEKIAILVAESGVTKMPNGDYGNHIRIADSEESKVIGIKLIIRDSR